MKKPLSLLFGTLILLFVFIVPLGFAQRSGFTGSWTGTDPAPPDGDGSNLTLNIAGNPNRPVRIHYTDNNASVACPRGDGTGYRASFSTTGTITDDILVLDEIQIYCYSPSRTLGPSFPAGTIVYRYDSASDTINDEFVVGSSFNRRGGRR